MLSGRQRSAVARAAQARLAQAAVASFSHPGRSLGIAALITILALVYASRLSLNADLSELLPDTFASVRALDALKDRFGGVGFVVVVGQGAEPDVLRKFADDITPKLEALETVRYVDVERPTAFFEKHALYFLDVEDLAVVAERLGAREAYERRKANPLYLDLEEDEGPPSVDFSDLQGDYSGRGDRKWMQAQLGEKYYIDTDKKMIALLAKPASAALDLGFAKKLVGEVNALIDSMDLSAYPGLEIGLTGRYTKRIDQQAVIESDLKIASLVALLLILGYLIIHFRRGMAVVLILLPLAFGLTWMFGFAGFVFGSLNILTGFIGAILLGLGIDHGIHLLGRYEAEAAESGPRSTEAIAATFGDTGRAVAVAGITTTVGFAGLGFSEFRAFEEFGIIAAAGTVTVVFAYLLCLPALLGVVTKFGWAPRRPVYTAATEAAARVPRLAPMLLLGTVIAVVTGAILLPSGRFDYDFAALENSDLPAFRLDLEVNKILGYSQTPVVILTDNIEQERAITEILRKQQLELGDKTTIDFLAGGADLVPTDQEAKRPYVEEISRIIKRIKPKWLDPEARPHLKMAKNMTAVEPFSHKDLPVAVKRQFQGVNSLETEGFVLAFPSIRLNDGDAVARFAEEVRIINAPGTNRAVPIAGEATILADILAMVSREAAPVLGGTILAVFLTALLLLGRFRDAILCLLPAAVTMVVTLGLLPLVGLRLNYLNIVMIPVLFGIGVDGGAHIVTRLAAGKKLTEVLGETGRAIAGAILTTSLGFGAMLLADHPGLNSLGELAVLGLGVNLLACMVSLPALVAWRPQLVQLYSQKD